MITLLIGGSLGLLMSWGGGQPNVMTTGTILFSARSDDAGNQSAGAARLAESALASERLGFYVQVSRASERVMKSLSDNGVLPTWLSPTGRFNDSAPQVLIDVPIPGVVEVRLNNGSLSQEAADQAVESIAADVAREMLATDAKQDVPALASDPVLTSPQSVETPPPSRFSRLPLAAVIMFSLGLGIVYLIVWHQGRIYSHKDIEHRFDARLLGKSLIRSPDGGAIALALCKGHEAGTRALLVPVSNHSEAVAALGDQIGDGGRALGIQVTVARTDPTGRERIEGVPPDARSDDGGLSGPLHLYVAVDGIAAEALRVAATVDIIALVVEYQKSTYVELTSTAQTLTEITDAEIAVIGI